jgi:hypothetical protein
LHFDRIIRRIHGILLELRIKQYRVCDPERDLDLRITPVGLAYVIYLYGLVFNELTLEDLSGARAFVAGGTQIGLALVNHHLGWREVKTDVAIFRDVVA